VEICDAVLKIHSLTVQRIQNDLKLAHRRVELIQVFSLGSERLPFLCEAQLFPVPPLLTNWPVNKLNGTVGP
jgi:hypothetical protein